MLEEWATGNDSFASDPPNATVSVFGKNGDGVRDAVVELKNPHMTGDELTFDVRVLEGSLTGGDGPAAVFIDIIGMPLTPLSFAGVARRTARRAAWYGAAAAPYLSPAAGVLPVSAAILSTAILPPLLMSRRDRPCRVRSWCQEGDLSCISMVVR